MTTSKYASLHSGLLARKGEALPAATHPLSETNFNDAGQKPTTLSRIIQIKNKQAELLKKNSLPLNSVQTDEITPQKLDKTLPEKTKSSPKVEEEIGNACFEADQPMLDSDAGSTKTSSDYRVSMKLSKKQRYLLRLMSAVTDRTQQNILSTALDKYLVAQKSKDMKNCGCFKKRLSTP